MALRLDFINAPNATSSLWAFQPNKGTSGQRVGEAGGHVGVSGAVE